MRKSTHTALQLYPRNLLTTRCCLPRDSESFSLLSAPFPPCLPGMMYLPALNQDPPLCTPLYAAQKFALSVTDVALWQPWGRHPPARRSSRLRSSSVGSREGNVATEDGERRGGGVGQCSHVRDAEGRPDVGEEPYLSTPNHQPCLRPLVHIRYEWNGVRWHGLTCQRGSISPSRQWIILHLKEKGQVKAASGQDRGCSPAVRE